MNSISDICLTWSSSKLLSYYKIWSQYRKHHTTTTYIHTIYSIHWSKYRHRSEHPVRKKHTIQGYYMTTEHYTYRKSNKDNIIR